MRRTTRSTGSMVAAGAVALLLGLGAAACSSPADREAADGTTTSGAPTTPTTAPVTTSSTAPAPTSAPSTSSAPSGPTSTGARYTPGQPCTLGSDPDCIDPLGLGEGTYLIGGGQCVADAVNAGIDPSMCADLDGDGRAGYPDRG